MKRYWMLIVGMMIGCAGTAAVPAVSTTVAQPFAASPHAPRWQQHCVLEGGIGSGDRRQAAVERINGKLREAGDQGWELVQIPVAVAGGGSQVWSDLLVCYKRPAP